MTENPVSVPQNPEIKNAPYLYILAFYTKMNCHTHTLWYNVVTCSLCTNSTFASSGFFTQILLLLAHKSTVLQNVCGTDLHTKISHTKKTRATTTKTTNMMTTTKTKTATNNIDIDNGKRQQSTKQTIFSSGKDQHATVMTKCWQPRTV
jgi:hypothetical protein